LLTAGVGLAASGLSDIFESGAKQHDCESAPNILMIVGGAVIAVAIPYTIALRINKKKANLYINKELVMITREIKTTIQLISMGVKINS